MSDTETQQPATIEQAPPRTKGELLARGIDSVPANAATGVPISNQSGGLKFDNMVQVMDFAKLMAVADIAVPEHCRGNAGICLAIIVKAVAWNMEPFAVAEKSYVVKDRVAYEAQLIHAVVEARAPIQRRLNSKYAGEGQTRTCTVIGMFTDGEIREYTTPQFANIKVKNSPLWNADADQQLWYYAVRAWARRWCPDVLLGVYTREELANNPKLGREEDDAAPALHERLRGSEPTGEGFRGAAHVDSELHSVAPAAQGRGVTVIEGKAEPEKPEAKATPKAQPKATARSTAKGGGIKGEVVAKPASERRRPPGEPRKPPTEADVAAIAARAEKGAPPKTKDEYSAYAARWLGISKGFDDAMARWDGERDMRDSLSVSMPERNRLLGAIKEKFGVEE